MTHHSEASISVYSAPPGCGVKKTMPQNILQLAMHRFGGALQPGAISGHHDGAVAHQESVGEGVQSWRCNATRSNQRPLLWSSGLPGEHRRGRPGRGRAERRSPGCPGAVAARRSRRRAGRPRGGCRPRPRARWHRGRWSMRCRARAWPHACLRRPLPARPASWPACTFATSAILPLHIDLE